MPEGRILVVEDEELVAADIVRCLERNGHTVCGTASNSEEALEAALREHPQLVLMDIDLGNGRSGIETARLIRETTGAPAIFLTGMSDRAVFEEAKTCKPLGYLIKPFQHEQLATLVDIALENARLHRSLAASELKFRTLAENSPDAIVRLDGNARFLHANSAATALLGIPAETLVGRTCAELHLPASLAALWSSLAGDTLASDGPVERDAIMPGPEGQRHFQIRALTEHRGNSEPPSLVATIRDVTARQLQERQLQEASQRLVYHANNSPLAVLEFDAAGHCLSWNHKAAEFFGTLERENGPAIVNCLPLIYPEDRERFEEVHDLLRSGGQASGFVTARFMHTNGSVAHGEWYLSSLLDDEGVCRSILCFLNDVSDRVRAQQSLMHANEEQERVILHRTSMLRRINEDLHREIATRMELERDLVRISEREHRRLGHDLHDGICQELAGIRFSVEAISRKLEKTARLRAPLDSIAEAVRRAIHHTRLLSRGLAPLQLECGDIASSLTELAETSATLFHIRCRFHCKGRPPELDLDTATNLYRIAQEAIQNAIKHGRAKSIEVDLDFSGHEARLTVTDDGRGLPEKSRPASPGDGMGLKIMRHRAELIRGTVTVHSADPRGVRVQCVFPK
jgi:PAS domain S-box-containing protein